ncbi:GNAT family N-acetyltransferase [Streptomyces sp. SID4919]|uniref:GNAT family N-acetyltransferase n=1 Tax=unclassified Streptomyces TaxID=2593676 RepID=UPI000823E0B7|nr:GNAT family N-acetyltransferase [Streptomyces sp. AmelKG-E11A]MYY12527.1 GNAT family N-acetyltransferase [Streptomyces sp. SID4919]SCK18763.1 Acetyltransferases [Streptomyces sp. AmelKG-E11A]
MSTPSLSLSALPVRRLTPRDTTLCSDLSQDRDWPREDHKWGHLLTAGRGYGIDAPDGEGLAGACVVTSYGPPGRPDLQAIGMVLVAERYSRRGLGRRLMRYVLEEAGSTPLTLHATANGRPLYEELGFTSVGQVNTVRGTFVAAGPTPRVSTRPATGEDLSTILRLDGEVFGSDRTHVVTRLPAFTDRLRVAEDHGRIIGYAGIWPNTDTDVIGPLIARDTETAQALITSLAAGAARPLRIDVDVRHEELLAWLRAQGLTLAFSNAVMTYGLAALPGDWTRRFAPVTVAAA